ncbi:hypothetical protein RRG08_062418 [Elysia crispata]|uniref:Peptidase S1 domain-containing protein n=1 Tax=Elysia crispata TaxID=231223 RepID=A0AAE1AZ63_9GAST|nr:hypothetical protein RRG08_062418 [Elysia crispata]
MTEFNLLFILTWLLAGGVTVIFCLAEDETRETASGGFAYNCPEGWVFGFHKCYKPHTAAEDASIKKIRLAAVACASENATLVQVRSEGERVFLSDLLLKGYPDVHTWHIGGKMRKKKWYWITMVEPKGKRRGRRRKTTGKKGRRYIAKAVPISETFWYRGGPSSSDAPPEPHPLGLKRYLTLSNRYSARNRKRVTAHALYWMAGWGVSRSGINFVCQKDAKLEINRGTCGRTQYQHPHTQRAGKIFQKIWNGNLAPYGKHPWLVGVKIVMEDFNGEKLSKMKQNDGAQDAPRSRDEPLCAATIINEYWLLGVAHCFWKSSKENLMIVAGDHNLNHKDAGEDVYEIEEIIRHENFHMDSSGEMSTYDIALLKIKQREGRGIVFNRYVQPICLPTPDVPFSEGQKCWIAGWGHTEKTQFPDEVQDGLISLASNKMCDEMQTPHQTHNRTLCAGDFPPLSSYNSPCQGDSGGPLVCEQQGSQTIVGVTSYGRNCWCYLFGFPDFLITGSPSVFTRVQTFLPWIEKTMKQHSASNSFFAPPPRP